jgi:hypothetical protein
MSESGDPDAATRTAFRLIGPDPADWVPDRPQHRRAKRCPPTAFESEQACNDGGLQDLAMQLLRAD